MQNHFNRFYFIQIVLIGICLPMMTFGQIETRTYQATKITGKRPVIDGHLNDAAWQQTAWGDHFVQFEPYNQKAPSQQTAFKILYDDNNLYVGIRCYDTEPEKIEKRLSRHDQVEGDWVAIGIDSYNDKLTAFAFSTNAMGVKFDAKFVNDNDMDVTWNPVWYVKTSIDSKGWVAEMRIPLSQLRFANRHDHQWGLQLIRNEFRKQETSVWQTVSKEKSGWVSQFGRLVGIDDIHPKKEVALTPYAMGKLEAAPREEGNPFATGTTPGYSIGIDGKVAVTNDLTLNFTINPDFGQVEADPSEVNLSAFETYFRERRPFFVEGSNIFNFPLEAGGGFSRENLFYSRRIGRSPHNYPDLNDGEYAKVPDGTRILGAFKLSGKTKNGWSVGMLESLTNYEQATIDSAGIRSKQGIEPMTNYFNARIQKDLNKGKTIVGGMFTATNRFIKDSALMYLPTAAYTGGIDFQNFWKDKTYRLSVNLIGSSVSGNQEAMLNLQESAQRYYQRPDNMKKVDSSLRLLQGSGMSIQFSKIGQGHWRYDIKSSMLSPGIELNDQGYLRISDIIKVSAGLDYEIWEPFSIFRTMSFHTGQWSGWDFSGMHIFAGSYFSFGTQFKNYWGFRFRIHRNYFNVDRHELRGGPSIRLPGNWNFGTSFYSDQRKKLTFGVNINRGKGDQNVSHSFNINLNISYQPIPALRLTFSPGYNNSINRFKYVDTELINQHKVYLTSSIQQNILSSSVRINVSLSPEFSVEYWGQPFMFSGKYTDFKRVSQPGQKTFYNQFHLYTGNEITFDADQNEYLIDDNGDGSTDFYLSNPDFSFVEFRSNLVARWEFVPGSTLYLVWSQGRSDYLTSGDFNFNNNMDQLIQSKATNVFLVKFSYRFSM